MKIVGWLSILTYVLIIFFTCILDSNLHIGNNSSQASSSLSSSSSSSSCKYYCYVYYRQEKCGQQQQQHSSNNNYNYIDDNELTYNNFPNYNNSNKINHSFSTGITSPPPPPLASSSSSPPLASSSSSSSSSSLNFGDMSEIKYGYGNDDKLLRQSIILVSKWIFPQLAFRLLHKIDETLTWNTDNSTCIMSNSSKFTFIYIYTLCSIIFLLSSILSFQVQQMVIGKNLYKMSLMIVLMIQIVMLQVNNFKNHSLCM